MKRIGRTLVCLLLLLSLCGCGETGDTIVPIESLSPSATSAGLYVPPESPAQTAQETQVAVAARIDASGMTLGTRINPPSGYTRVFAAEGSFAAFLRAYAVRASGAEVLQYDGSAREDARAAAVLDITLGKKNHEGPAGAAARLVSEYLYAQGEYDRISFRIGSKLDFSFEKWRKGCRLNDRGTDWVSGGEEDSSEDSFTSYLSTLFVYISMSTLEKDLTKIEDVDSDEIRVGDVYIGTNSQGRQTCLMVADLCRDDLTGESLMLLVQGGMPAQQAHIVKNPKSEELSPWFPCNFTNELVTPDVTVTVESRYRFTCLTDEESETE